MSQRSREQSRGFLGALSVRVQKRVLVPALLLVLGLALYFAPQVPSVRAWLLGRVQSVVANLGYDLSYQRSAGNLWHGVTLRGVGMTGSGVDMRLGRLELGYNPLALIVLRFPFSVSAADVVGDINPQEVSVPRGGGGNVPIRPVLRGVDVSGVNLNVNDVPYTLPDLSLTDLGVNDTNNGLGVAATLATPQGEAQVDADVGVSPFTLSAKIPRVDLAIAKHWFDGIESGRASGTVMVAGGEAQADLNVIEAAVTVAGATLTGLSGPVRYNTQQDGQVRAELSGRALGGPVQGDAVVDIPAQQWRADVTGNAKLAEAAAWLARGNLPQNAASGNADVSLSLSGWQEINLTGQARGQGEVFGRPLRDLNVDFGFTSDAGTNVQANGTLAGGPFTADVTPSDAGGFAIRAQADGVNLSEAFQANLRADLQTSAQGAEGSGLSGDARLGLSGTAAGREVTLNADARAQENGWNVDLTGQDALGATLGGEVALRGEQVTGELRAADVSLEGTPVQADPLNAVLSADGTLDSLPVALRLGTQDELTPSVAGLELTSDLSGELKAVLGGTRLQNINAQFGPLRAQGTFDVAEQTGRLEYTLNGLEVAGRATGTLDVRGGVLELNQNTLNTQATLQAADLSAFGVGPLNMNADVALNRDAQAESQLDGTVNGALTFLGAGQAEDATLDLAGTLRDLSLTGTLPAERLVGADAVALRGDVQLDAQANLLAQRYDVGAVWQAPSDGQSLQLQAQGQGGQVEGTLVGEGLDASFSTQGERPRFGLEADTFTLSPFIAQPSIDATLNGALSYADTWDGTLGAQVQAPVEATAQLIGAGERLRLEAQSDQGALNASVTGQVLPSLNLNVDASAAERARLSGTLSGTAFDGTLSTEAVETPQASVGAQTAQVQGSLSNGLALQVAGESVDLNLVNGSWTGGLELPFTLRGEPHTLTGSLMGETASPQLEGNIQGPLVQGPLNVSRQGGQASLNVDAAPFLPTQDAQLNADLSFAQDLSWTAQVTGDGTYRNAPVGLQANVSGQRQTYQGEGALQVREGTVPFQVSGSGAEVEVASQLEDFDLANAQGLIPGLPTGTASGNVQVSRSSEGLRYNADLNATGTAQGQPLELQVSANDETGVDVTGEVAGTRVALGNAASGAANTFDLSFGEGPLVLQAQLQTGEMLSVQGDGTYQGEPLSIAGSLEPATLTGNLNAALGDATLSANATEEQIQGQLDAPNGLLNVAQPLSAEFAVTRTDNQFTLSTLRAALPQSDLSLDLSGAAWPNPNLTGSLQTGVLPEPVGLSLVQEDGYLLTLQPGDLTLLADLSPSFALESLAARGGLELANTELRSDLTWQPESGFSGEAQTVFAQGDADATLNLIGQGNLAASGLLNYGGEEVATLDAALSRAPWRDRSVSGNLNVNAPVSNLSPAWPGEPLTLLSDVSLAGTLTQPTLSGPVSLEGALGAAGALRASREGTTFDLRGENMAVNAQASAQGWTLSADTDALNIQPLAPQLNAPRLSVQLQGEGAWGSAPNVEADTLLLETVRSRVSGQASFAGPGTLFAPLELNLNLAEVGDLRGKVEGSLLLGSATSLEGTPLSGALLVRDAGLAASNWSLGGALDIGGSLSAPTLETTLAGQGSAQGELSARLEPRRYAALTSTLALGPVASDVRLRWRLGELAAQGQVAYEDYALTLDSASDLDAELDSTFSRSDAASNSGLNSGLNSASNSASTTLDNTIILSGNQKLEGWRGVVNLEEAQLTGDLSSVSPQLGGAVNLAAAWGSAVEVAGSFTDLRAGSLELGNLTLGSENAVSEDANSENTENTGSLQRLTLQGGVLAASLNLQGTPAWQLSRLELPLPNESTLRAEGAGTTQSGAVDATLESTVLEDALSVPLAVRYDAGVITAQSQADLFSGALNLDARYAEAGGWSGTLDLLGLELQSAAADVQGELSGALTSPALGGTLLLEQAQNTLEGTFALSPGRAQLQQRLISPLLEEPLALTGTLAPLELSLSTSPQNQLRVTREEGALEAAGALSLGVGPARVRLKPSERAGEWVSLLLSAPQTPGFALEGALPNGPPQDWLGEVLSGFTLSGVQKTQGSVRVQAQPSPRAALSEVRWRTALGTLELTGEAAPGAASVQGTWRGVENQATNPVMAGPTFLPWLANVSALPFEVEVTDSRAELRAANGIGTLDANLDWAAQRAALNADLALGSGQLNADLRYTPDVGPTGDIQLLEVPLLDAPNVPATTLTTLLTADPRGLRGSGTLGVGDGQATVQGQLGWARVVPQGLLATYLPQADDAQSVQLRLNGFNVSQLALLQRRVPNLNAPLSGVVRLNGNQVIGQIVSPDLSVANTALPTRVELNGTVQSVEARASLGRSQLRVAYDGSSVSGFFDLEQFPLEILAEAATDASTVSASATGAARFEIPLDAPARSYVQVATERLILKREGASEVTRGEVALRYDEGGLIIDRAEFRGRGFWRARGRVTRDVLDLSLQAEDADVTPLLSLVPRLAALQVGAQGSLNLEASGSLAEPRLRLTSPDLGLRLAGSRYRLTGTNVTLNNDDLNATAALEGVAPVGGNLSLRADGQLSLLPYNLENFVLAFDGGATLPVLGAVQNITGEVTTAANEWLLESRARLGQPMTLSGTLAPLDLELRGTNLNLSASNFFVASSATNVALDITTRGENFLISGDAIVNSARLTPSRAQRATSGSGNGSGNGAASGRGNGAANQAPSAPTTNQVDVQPSSATPEGASVNPTVEPGTAERNAAADTPLTPAPAAPTTPSPAPSVSPSFNDGANIASGTESPLDAAPPTSSNPVLRRVLFEDLNLRAQSSVQFRAGFGTAELTFDLDMTGSAAAPELSGVARTLQGTVRFSSNDFVIEEGTATFEPSSGVFPALDLAALATFDKQDALGDLRGRYAFVEPREGNTFSTQLDVTGTFEEVEGRPRPVLDLEPSLSSDAVVQEQGSDVPRPLEEPELVSLLTLGRLQLGTGLAGGDSLAGTVAEGALDTAVDFLVLSELQNALGDALGVGLFEIRTSAISSLLNQGESDPFGVSLRVGGYIGDDLFASLEVGSFDNPDYVLSNEFNLRYDLAPLEINLGGGVNFLDDTSFTAVTDFNFSLGYSITPLISLEAGLSASAGSSRSASAGFGVSFTW